MSANVTRVFSDVQGRLCRQVGEYRLVGGDGSEQGLVVSQERFRIGTQRGNDLVLADESISRYHLEILIRPEGYLLRDLDSTNGSWVEGIRVREAYLPPAAKLRLGRLELEFSVTGTQRETPLDADTAFAGLVGASPAMREVFALLKRVAPTDATVLIEGESGTGKEMVAQAIHRASARSGGPLVVFDCAAVPLSLVESELFGYERGAFTGADRSRAGHVEEADGGTLFLDELGELPAEVQPKLLRLLETREVRRLGATAGRKVDLRLIAATNRDLAREVNQGGFRADLYYRVAVVQLRLPPLRERPEDIRPLVTHFIREALPREPGRADSILEGISDENWARLARLPWRGNVRELRNFIERTLVLSDGLHTGNVPAVISAKKAGSPGEMTIDLDQPFTRAKAERIAEFERAYLMGQLERHAHNISAAARASGLDRMNFKRLLKKHR